MSGYFQKIAEDQFNADASFVVKESKKMHLFIGAFLLLISILAIKSSVYIAMIPAIFAVVSLRRARKNQVVMTINKNGFFYYGSLITNWNNFVSARFIDEAPSLSINSFGISDKFFLSIRYYKDDGRCYDRKIALTNTQDKSEEEIV